MDGDSHHNVKKDILIGVDQWPLFLVHTVKQAEISVRHHHMNPFQISGVGGVSGLCIYFSFHGLTVYAYVCLRVSANGNGNIYQFC